MAHGHTDFRYTGEERDLTVEIMIVSINDGK